MASVSSTTSLCVGCPCANQRRLQPALAEPCSVGGARNNRANAEIAGLAARALAARSNELRRATVVAVQPMGRPCVMNYCEVIRAANPMSRLVALAARPLQRRRLCSRPGVWSLSPVKGAPEVLRLGDVLEVATAAANRHSSVSRPSSTSLLAQTLAGDTLETLHLILIANPKTSTSLCIAVRTSERWLQYASMTCKGEPGRKKMERCRLC